MKYILSTLAVSILFFASCKQNATNKADEVALANPAYQEMKKMEVQGDKAIPELVLYQKGLRDLLHNLEKANQISGKTSMVDSTSMKVRNALSELNRAEDAFASYKTGYNARLDTMVTSKRDAFVTYGKQDAEASRDMVLYAVKEAKLLTRALQDKGIVLSWVPQEK
jgi:hypothetical protein